MFYNYCCKFLRFACLKSIYGCLVTIINPVSMPSQAPSARVLLIDTHCSSISLLINHSPTVISFNDCCVLHFMPETFAARRRMSIVLIRGFQTVVAEGFMLVRHKVYKNIKLNNQTKQPLLLKVRYKEQRSEYMTPFISHSGLHT